MIRALLERLLAEIAAGCAPAYEAMLAEAADVCLTVRVEDEGFCLSVNATAIEVRDETDTASVSLEIDRWTLRQLILGECDRHSVIMDDRLRVQGLCADLARVDQLVVMMVAGAGRVRGAERILDEFLEATTPRNASAIPGATQ